MTAAQQSPAWMEQAACLDWPPDLWFPVERRDTDDAVAICSTCPARIECLAWSIETRADYGVWGGLTERQRARLRAAAS